MPKNNARKTKEKQSGLCMDCLTKEIEQLFKPKSGRTSFRSVVNELLGNRYCVICGVKLAKNSAYKKMQNQQVLRSNIIEMKKNLNYTIEL